MIKAMTPLEAMMIDAKKCNAAFRRVYTRGEGTGRISPQSAPKPHETCRRVVEAHLRGLSPGAIATLTGFTLKIVNYHLKNIRVKPKSAYRKKLEARNEEYRTACAGGLTQKETAAIMGVSKSGVADAALRLNITFARQPSAGRIA